jgi:hypothetical protein
MNGTIARMRGAAEFAPCEYGRGPFISENSSISDLESSRFDQSWTCAIDTLLTFRKLEDDWDGEGTEAPSHELVDSAIRLAQRLKQLNWDAPDHVVPSVNSTVSFGWKLPNRYVEIEIVAPGVAEGQSLLSGSRVAVPFSFSQF